MRLYYVQAYSCR